MYLRIWYRRQLFFLNPAGDMMAAPIVHTQLPTATAACGSPHHNAGAGALPQAANTRHARSPQVRDC